MARLTQFDLVEINKTFEERTPQELLAWAHATFGDRLAGLSSMQRAGNVICHMISGMDFDIRVYFVDTGVLFQETLDTRDRLVEQYGVTIETLHPELTMLQQTEKHGVLYLSPEGQQQCCQMRKSDPLLNRKDDFDALIGSLRRADGGRRAQCPIVSVDTELNCVRVNPLVNFSDDQMAEYIASNDLILNPLHEQGYATIGCNRCTTPVLPSEPKRAGRWRHLGQWAMYCGINPTDLDPTLSPAVDLPQDLVDRILGRETDFMI